MGAVVAILTESVMEAVKSFYRVRKAMASLQSIAEAEAAFRGMEGDTPAQQSSQVGEKPDGTTSLATSDSKEDDDDFVFVDADEERDNAEEKTTETYQGLLESDGASQDTNKPLTDAQPKSSATVKSKCIDCSDITNPTDLFIHSAFCMHQGMLLLMLSLVPPSFSRLLSIVGFRGDREQGLALLWEATRCTTARSYPTSGIEYDSSMTNGAIAGLVILGYYSGIVSSLDILPPNTIPRAECDTLLRAMRSKLPGSRLWMVQEAGMRSLDRKVDEAITVLEDIEPSPLKQVEALRWFEHGLATMFAHQYQNCADSFIKCTQMNNWSHGLYYYIAASAHVELYRIAKYSTTSPDPSKAARHAEKAKECLDKIPATTGRKKFIGKQLPFDAFVAKKLEKWKIRSQDWDVQLIDAIGVSPIEEIAYFWGAHRKMNNAQLREVLDRLWWNDGGAMDVESRKSPAAQSRTIRNPLAKREHGDEKASLTLLRASAYRRSGEVDYARQLLRTHIIDAPVSADSRNAPKDNWAPPVARYELAVCVGGSWCH